MKIPWKLIFFTVMPNLTTNQKIAIAVSVPVVGVLLYFLVKWAREDEEEFVSAEESDEFIASSDLVSEVQIQRAHVGAIIGRAGSVIKQIQKESQTRINFKDDDEDSEEDVEQEESRNRLRTLLVRGSRERIKHAEVLIQKIIDEQPILEKAKVEIPQRLIGRIIGKGGKTIRQLCRISGAKIKIDRDNEMGDTRTCDIVGTQTQIEAAKQLIDEKIGEDKAFTAKRSSREGKDKLKFAELPIDGDYFGVYVSAMETPGYFWIQTITKDAKQLDDLVEAMTQFYGDKGMGHRLIPLKVGDQCCATFEHDESWYRAEVVEVMEDTSEVRVYYLDFGDTGLVSMMKVKELRKEYSYLPFQAIACSLANVQPKEENWTQEECEAFEKFTCCAQWKVLMARVVYYNEKRIPCIELVDTNGEQDVNIEKKLVEKGYAIWKGKPQSVEKEENEEAKKTKKSALQSSKSDAVEQIISEERERALQQFNQQFRSPGFQDVSCDTDTSSDSFDLSSPINQNHSNKKKAVVDEPTIAPEQREVVHCADISQLESLFGLNVHSSVVDGGRSEIDGVSSSETLVLNEDSLETLGSDEDCSVPTGSILHDSYIKDTDLNIERSFEPQEECVVFANNELEKSKTMEEYLDKDTSKSIESQEGCVGSINKQEASEINEGNLELNTLENSETQENMSGSEELHHPEIFKTFRQLDELFIEFENFCAQHSESFEEDEAAPSEVSKDVVDRAELSETPISTAHVQETSAEPLAISDKELSSPENRTSFISPGSSFFEIERLTETTGGFQTDNVLRRSYSEDRCVGYLSNGSLGRSSSEITVSPSKDNDTVDGSKHLTSKSLSSLSSMPKGGKRVLAANFGGQISNKTDDSDLDDDEGDTDSLYLSAVEDSDSTGFVSAVGSRTNLEIDADSDATPSGYLSPPGNEAIEIGGNTDLEDQARLIDATLLVEKLKQYADK